VNGEPLPRSVGCAVLRRLAVADLQEFQAYRNDPMIARYQSESGKTDAEARAFLLRMNTAPLLQPGAWSQIGIADLDSLALMGDIGLLLAADRENAELGIRLNRASQGRGIATAAAREAIKLVFEQTDAARVLGIADARNLPSIRMLQRVGMRMQETREAVYRDEACIDHVYAISRPVGAA
jgi:RimJ/RimL family protein N-acetyltransferase